MLINTDLCLINSAWSAIDLHWSELIGIGIIADQNSGIDSNADQFRSMPINGRSSRIDPALIGIDQHWSALVFTNVLLMPWSSIDWHWEKLLGIDQQRSALRGISDQCHDFDRHWSALGIDRGSPDNGLSIFSLYTLKKNVSFSRRANFN